MKKFLIILAIFVSLPMNAKLLDEDPEAIKAVMIGTVGIIGLCIIIGAVADYLESPEDKAAREEKAARVRKELYRKLNHQLQQTK